MIVWNNRLKLGMAFFAVFALILIPSLNIPMHSDDYYYYFLGNSPREIYEHYLTWSGRVVANTISSTLLYNFNHTAIEVLNSLAFLALCFFISFIPISASKEGHKYTPFMLIFVFLSYWVANPKLGETSFWIVGSANYLWTNMFIAIFVVAMFMAPRCNNKLYPLATFLLGVLAGCSNENTSIVVVMLTIVLLIFERNKIALSLGFIGAVIGAAVLLLAPGNQNRATLYTDWHNTGFRDKFFAHFFERFPGSIEVYWMVLLMMVVAVFFVAANKMISKRSLNYSLVFLVCALLSNAAFLGSPAFPERSMNGGLCFLLISASFPIAEICQFRNKSSASCVAIITAGLLFYFAPSYYWFVNSTHGNWKQDKIRMEAIADAKKQGIDTVYIPDFYFTTLAKDSDKLDTYQNQRMADYFGVKKIIPYQIPFDYSKIRGGKYTSLDLNLSKDIELNSIKYYNQVDRFGLSDIMMLRFRLTNTAHAILGDDKVLVLKVQAENKKNKLALIKNIDLMQIGDFFYASADLQGHSESDINNASLSIIEKNSGKVISTVDFK